MIKTPAVGILRLLKPATLGLVAIALLIGSSGCRPEGGRTAERLAEDSEAAREIESSLTFNNITLEQANEQGETVWKVQSSQAIYSQDKQSAQIQNPNGELYQDGKPIYRIQARRGELRDNGEKIMLRGQVVATDIRSGAVLRGDRLEWLPEQGLLTIRNNVRGTHPQVNLSADEGKVFTEEQRMELTGKVVAVSTDPEIRLQGEHLIWNIEQKTLVSDRSIQIDRLQNNRITDTATGNQATFNLTTKVATLTQNGQLTLSNPPVQVSSNSLEWRLRNQLIVSDQPVTVVHRQQQVRMTANQGRLDAQKRIFYLTGNVQAVAQRNQSQLRSDRLTWTIPTQDFVAEGSVDYRQANPVMTVRGTRASGKLQNQTIVVSGGRVVTEIIPTQPLP